MELQIQNGDYVPDGLGGFRRLTGARPFAAGPVAWSRGGGFPFMPELGSRLYLVLRRNRQPARRWRSSMWRRPWLERAGLRVTEVSLAQEGDRGLLTVRLDWQGEALAVQTLL